MSLTFKGFDRVKRDLSNLAKGFPDRVGQALYAEGEAIMTDSKRNYVPVDLGVLRSSGTVNRPERRGKDISVSLTYGGAASAYALAVHEHPSAHSPRSWRMARGSGGRFRRVNFHPDGHGPKYLEKPMRTHMRGMKGRIMARLVT